MLDRLILLVCFGAMAWYLLGDRPRAIELVYDLPDDPAPARAEVVLQEPDGKVLGSINWMGFPHAADRQVHRPLLQEGTWDLRARLEFADGSVRQVERTITVGPADERIVVHLQ